MKELNKIEKNGTLLRLLLTDNGEAAYSVEKDCKTVISLSKLGLITKESDFCRGLTFESVSTAEIDEKYTVISHKKAIYNNSAKEASVIFSKDGFKFVVCARVYEDGFAVRYCIEGNVSEIISERTEIAVSNAERLWYMPYHYCYEGEFKDINLEDKTKVADVSMPALLSIKENYLLLSEADLNGGYAGSMLSLDNGTFTTVFVPQQKTPISVSDRFQSPWRFGVFSSLSNVFECTMAENLTTHSDNADYSFVKTGAASWSWLSGGYWAQRNAVSIKKNIDLCADMGWKYFIMDDGWQPKNKNLFTKKKKGSEYGYFKWINEVINYATEKGVGLIAWTRCDNLRTPFMRERLAEWANLGIKGIKVDFFDSECQDRMKLYDDIYKTCAKNKLIVNAHGANKPTGEIATHPNVITREGIRGEEYGKLDSYQYTVIPFTRGAVGPADVTETLKSRDGTVTEGFQAAVSFVVYSGLHCFASSPEEYAASAARPLYKNFPCVWDDTRLLDGAPGEFCSVMRSSSDVYYIGSLTVKARTVKFTYDFLPDGLFTAEIFKSDDSGCLTYGKSTISNKDSLEFSLKNEDGLCIKISPKQ